MKRWWKRGLPGWIYSGGGGAGFGGVVTNNTLTGTGLVATPLGVAGMPEIFYTVGYNSANPVSGGANEVNVSGFALPYPVTFSRIFVYVATADGTSYSDLGVYTKAGALIANIGAQIIAATGWQGFATVQGSQTILPSLYLFAYTNVSGALVLGGSPGLPSWYYDATQTVSVGGALPASIGAIAVAPNPISLTCSLY